MFAAVRDTVLYFDVEGSGLLARNGTVHQRPTAMLVHGGPGADHLSDKARYGGLSKRMQLVYHDMRGHGRSGRPDPSTYTLDDNVEDLDALRRHLGLERVILLGTSYGGRVAMAYAARYPTAVSHLILIATSAHGGSVQRAREIAATKGTPEQIAACEDLYAGRIDSSEKFQRYLDVTDPLYSFAHDPTLPTRPSISILEPEPLNRAFGPGGFMWSLDLRSELRNISAPTLIIGGRHDWRCAPEFSEELHQLIAGSDLRIFENSAHSIARDEPDKLIDTILGFIVYRMRIQ